MKSGCWSLHSYVSIVYFHKALQQECVYCNGFCHLCFSFVSSVISFTHLAGRGHLATKSEKASHHPRKENGSIPKRLKMTVSEFLRDLLSGIGDLNRILKDRIIVLNRGKAATLDVVSGVDIPVVFGLQFPVSHKRGSHFNDNESVLLKKTEAFLRWLMRLSSNSQNARRVDAIGSVCRREDQKTVNRHFRHDGYTTSLLFVEQ